MGEWGLEIAAAIAPPDEASVSSGRDLDHLLSAFVVPASSVAERAGFAAGWRALGGPLAYTTDPAYALDPEARLLRAEESELLAFALGLLPHRRRRIVAQTFGLLGERQRTGTEIAHAEQVSRGRILQILAQALRVLRGMTSTKGGGFSEEAYERLFRAAARRSRRFTRGERSPPLYAPRPRSRRQRTFQSEAAAPGWWSLSRPISLGELHEFLLRLASRLRIECRVEVAQLGEAPPFQPQVEERPAASDAASRPDDRVRCLWWETPYSWARYTGGEGSRVAIDAEVVLPDGCTLLLTGAEGEFIAYAAWGSGGERRAKLEAAWAALVSEATGGNLARFLFIARTRAP
jgi:hypothetical protein